MHPSKLHIANHIHLIETDEEFNELASKVYKLQLEIVPIFGSYLTQVERLHQPWYTFLPIEAFKHHSMNSEESSDLVFKSSGTTGSVRSKHAVHDSSLYSKLSITSFELLYGSLLDWNIIAYLPSYEENGDSSLIYMVDQFIRATKKNTSRFVRSEEELNSSLVNLQSGGKNLLIGVSYALLDYAENHHHTLPHLIIMETGGMKGRKQEMTRESLHQELKRSFPESKIHSEYGMTELLSQAYSADGKWFQSPPWLKPFVTEINDPFHILASGKRGLLAFVDLANLHSCSFIQTRDIGIINDRGQFSVEGRLDNSDIRGCNLLHTE